MSKRKRNRSKRPAQFTELGLSSLLETENPQIPPTNPKHSKVGIRPGVGIILLVLTAGAVLGLTSIARWRSDTTGLSIVANPLPSPPSMPAGAPAKEYVYAGSSLISTVEPFREAPNDLAVWRPSSGTWYIMNSQGQIATQTWGVADDKPAPGDFDGDGKTDFSVFRPSNYTWYIVRSSDSSIISVTFGAVTDVPAVADYS